MGLLERIEAARHPPPRDPLAGVPGRRAPRLPVMWWFARPGTPPRLLPPAGDPFDDDAPGWREGTR